MTGMPRSVAHRHELQDPHVQPSKRIYSHAPASDGAHHLRVPRLRGPPWPRPRLPGRRSGDGRQHSHGGVGRLHRVLHRNRSRLRRDSGGPQFEPTVQQLSRGCDVDVEHGDVDGGHGDGNARQRRQRHHHLHRISMRVGFVGRDRRHRGGHPPDLHHDIHGAAPVVI